jgi:hypothetical protein
MLQQKHKVVYRLSPSCIKLLPRKSGHLSTPPGVSACIAGPDVPRVEWGQQARQVCGLSKEDAVQVLQQIQKQQQQQ